MEKQTRGTKSIPYVKTSRPAIHSTATSSLHSSKLPTSPPVNFPISKSKPRPPRTLIRPIMPHRHLHPERVPTIPQILRDEHRRLLANQQRRAIRIAAHIVGTDGQIRALETPDAVDVEALVQDAVLDDRVALARGHGAGAKTW